MSWKCNYKEKLYLFRYYVFSFLPKYFQKFVIAYKYKKTLGKQLNIDNPVCLSEKIQYLKIYSYKNGVELADKLKAKEYVKNLIPELNFAKVYTAADSFEKLDFSLCPKSFIIKLNHSWKTNTIVYDKNLITNNEYKSYADYYKNALKINYEYWAFFEFEYRNIPHKIFAEEYLGIPQAEYEVYCFNGEVQFVKIDIPDIDESGLKIIESYIYSKNKERLDFYLFFTPLKECPLDFTNFNKIVLYAEKLSKKFDFVRIDFMEINHDIYFLEFTFSPYSGFIKFMPDKYDKIYGEKLIIHN